MSDESAKKLAELEARRAARAADRAARMASSSADQKLQEAQRLDELEEALVAAESAHGLLGRQLAVVHCRYADGGLVGGIIVKRPAPAHYERYLHAYADLSEGKRRERTMDLIRHCLVWPEIGRLEAMIAELPATAMGVANAITRLAGDTKEETEGKP